MKRLDLHIHTLPTISDADFTFNINVLKQYIEYNQLDAIAITNHNLFSAEQYDQIVDELKPVSVFPGIEINIGIASKGHLIVITDPSDIIDFSKRCDLVNKSIIDKESFITIEKFYEIFGDKLNSYLLIPHYSKKPTVHRDILCKLSEHILCGEAASIKDFLRQLKDASSPTPVYFSDFRAKVGADRFPSRHTFLDIGDISLAAIKSALRDKNKVSLSESDGNQLLRITPEIYISTGLNVILGKRASGKTYTLDKINEYFLGVDENPKYIRQFDLLERDKEKAEKEFQDILSNQQSTIVSDYLRSFKQVVEDVREISLEDDEKRVSEYLQSLIKFATEEETHDIFSNCTLYKESLFSESSYESYDTLIKSVCSILDDETHQALIDKFIDRNKMKELLRTLIELEKKQRIIRLKQEDCNKIIKVIKGKLQSQTSAERIPDIDFAHILFQKQKIQRFEHITKCLQVEREIYSEPVGKFMIKVKLAPFKGALELKTLSHSQAAFSEAFRVYSEPYKFLEQLKLISQLNTSDYYKYFVRGDYQLLNEYGIKVSGGERAEFKLLREINNAHQHTALIIDEPESSFDNVFLLKEMNKLLKDLSQEMPVVIVTHNSTVGASIQPDYILYTERQIDASTKTVNYKVYNGYPTDKELKSNSGESIENWSITLDCLEAGGDAYEERGERYETLKD